ncbi:peptidoglycan DD-metalloendopeptidase family protein [Pikeienuella piscinae]|uniref:Peptidoglycan DD-metalloendopeptidase family protein n=1 Tax=Pikeienuella piscinae TaxID=2748098 RepID=A0A7M3T627_9RHOB|nr:peptidoglycan DD-metalloendopeptidase family protein [Pikeienuella piscinae]QIE57458.1 peptidoglycan DD-metalloendopeptidase family protein [Pikeienuella piscinae]
MRTALLLLSMMLLAGVGPEERAAEMLERAEASLAAARTPGERLAALGRAAQAEEAALAAIRENLRSGANRRAEIEAGLEGERRRLVAVLSALQRIESAPRAAALAHPDGVVAGARAGMQLAALAPALEAETARLSALLAELSALDVRRDIAASDARRSLAALQRLRAEIAEIVDRDRGAGNVSAATRARLVAEGEALAQSAKSLKALAAALPSAVAEEEAPRAASFAAARGALPPPVEGELERRFGAPGAGGPLEGVEISAPAYAAVYAPWRSVVRFAGPFGEDGVVVMLEPDPEILIVFSGLAAARVQLGDVVAAGEPLGALGGPPPAAEEFLIAATTPVESLGRETLYMEVRRGGAPVDPAIWFALDTEEGDRQ